MTTDGARMKGVRMSDSGQTNFYTYTANHEARTVHRGTTDGRARRWDPRCNIPTARAEGAEGTETIGALEANRLVDEEGYAWCGWCS